MVSLFLRSAEEEEGQVGMALAETADQANVIVQRPAAQRQILRPARSNVDAQRWPAGKILSATKSAAQACSASVKKIS